MNHHDLERLLLVAWPVLEPELRDANLRDLAPQREAVEVAHDLELVLPGANHRDLAPQREAVGA